MDAYFPEFMKEYKKLLDPRKLWDIARIVILYVHGGIYLDHDIECQPGVSFSAPGWADNATELLLPRNYFMGSVPGHPFWRVYWRNVMDLLPKHKEASLPRSVFYYHIKWHCHKLSVWTTVKNSTLSQNVPLEKLT
ncbi:hypothetical protein EMIHUDRAFT_221063 [Emiliania huxleyi CCMP1516]|uniref:Alpha 1,4-glycosyltransferase domain-containing protein n=2 Tax=Emiliania huxleyi TaxID=2903 RepID=A0A0D3HZX4_EMIH1|nr:hypothetical protein EMIHUDRAFT_221063 [Emiliania huxleyi CCMP1516]EOD04559.1 hypothetical protein EMIHUDRAFT_221063 [Emiliania huxleyi CCMP1516]|eukprot:XP_005756988.1 hypothetical protein EMIHUDRAFT_221063 [Emiliania huxleyi CCMP1516]